MVKPRSNSARPVGWKPKPMAPHEPVAAPLRERTATAAVWLLVLASIVLLPDAFVRWMLPKDVLAAIAVVLASVAIARGRLPRWFVIASTVAAALALGGVLISAAPAVQVWGRWPRYEGIVALPVYFGAVWAGARLVGPLVPAARVRTLLRAVATASIALGAVSLLETLGARPFPSDLARPGSLTGNATDQGVLGALFLALLALPTLRAWTRPGRSGGEAASLTERLWLSTALALAAASVVLSASRAGLLAAGIVVLVLLVLEIIGGPRGFALHSLGIATVGALLLLGGALVVPLTRNRLLGTSPLASQSLEGRFGFWQDSLAVLGAHPFGVGVNGFLNANVAASIEGSTLDSPHNLIFQVAMAGGIPLLLLVLGIAATVAVCGVRAWRSAAGNGLGRARGDVIAAALAGLTGYGVALLTHFTAPSTTIVAAALAGILLAQAPDSGLRKQLRATKSRWSAARSAVLATWAVFLVVTLAAEMPLASGVAAAARGDLIAADTAFATASSLRPWDADLESISAQAFAAAADGGLKDAAPRAVAWAERSRATLPGTVATERALAVGQLNSGNTFAAGQTLTALAARAPKDISIAVQNAVVRYILGDISGAELEVNRALTLDPGSDAALRLRDILAVS